MDLLVERLDILDFEIREFTSKIDILYERLEQKLEDAALSKELKERFEKLEREHIHGLETARVAVFTQRRELLNKVCNNIEAFMT